MMGRGKEASGGRERSSTLGDAFESLVGAIYLDSGLESAREFILKQAQADLEQIEEQPVDINPKGNLQELLQSISPSSAVYEVITESGPEHAKTFVVEAHWEGIVLGKGQRAKQEAGGNGGGEEALERSVGKSGRRDFSPGAQSRFGLVIERLDLFPMHCSIRSDDE
jgi:ribonuclease-3